MLTQKSLLYNHFNKHGPGGESETCLKFKGASNSVSDQKPLPASDGYHSWRVKSVRTYLKANIWFHLGETGKGGVQLA